MRQKKKFEIFSTGKIGPVVFYLRNGTKCSRVHNPHIKQTKATIAAAKRFGCAIRYAKWLRYGIKSIMHDEKDRSIMYKMNKAVQYWLRMNPDLMVCHDRLMYLHDLNINERERIRFQVEVDWSQAGNVLVKFPAFNPKRHLAGKSGTSQIIWKIAVAGVITTGDLPWPVPGSETSFRTPYDDVNLPENEIKLPYTLLPGTINIVAIALHLCFDKHGTRQKDKTWEPAGLVGAYYNV
jgi:hypothetical protein